MNKTAENTDKLLHFIATKYEQGELDNRSLVQFNIKFIIDNQ
jgi:hypothetical protein